MILRPLLLLAAFLVYGADANCKSTDAKWKRNLGPTVVQSSKSDPATLKVSWDKIIENVRCVDEWDLRWWPIGGNKTSGQKMNIKSKSTTSKMVSVDPCVEYNFEVSFKENDLFGTDTKPSKITKYTSNANPKIVDMDRKNFEVTYYYDNVKKVHDLSKASIKFKKDILENPSCIKFIEIVGVEVPKSQRPKTLTTNRISGREMAPGYGGGSYGSIGGSGGYSGSKGSLGGSGGYPGHSVGGSGGYPGHSVGGSGGHPGHQGGYGSNSGGYNSGGWSSSTGRSSYSSVASGGSSKGTSSYSDSRGGLGSQDSFYSSTNKGTTTTYRPPVDDDWFRGKRSLWGSKKKTTTTPRPQLREPYPGSNIGADGKASGKILPPFRKDILEVTAHIRPCRSYKFSVKIVSPKGSTLATVKDLFLPLLGEMDAYKPPKLAQMFKVESNAHQFQIKLVPGYGVPGECLGEFFHAVDNHIADLQQDASYHQRQEMSQLRRGEDLLKKLNEQKSMTLTKQFGCKCAANRLLLNTTDAKAHKKYKDVFGTYEYHGEQNGKPYYKKIEVAVHPPLIRNKRFIGNVQSNDKGSISRSGSTYSSQSSYSSSHSSSSPGTPSTHSSHTSYSSTSGGYPGGGSSAGGWTSQTSLATPTKHDPNFKSYHLYWDAKEKTWVVGLLMDGKHHVLRVKTKKNHVAKCPADPETLHMWEYSGTLTWHDDKLMRASCSLTPSL